MLRKVAVNREVMVAVANSQAPGLQGFLDSIKALNIPNFMARGCCLRRTRARGALTWHGAAQVVAIDAALAKTLTASVRAMLLRLFVL